MKYGYWDDYEITGYQQLNGDDTWGSCWRNVVESWKGQDPLRKFCFRIRKQETLLNSVKSSCELSQIKFRAHYDEWIVTNVRILR